MEPFWRVPWIGMESRVCLPVEVPRAIDLNEQKMTVGIWGDKLAVIALGPLLQEAKVTGEASGLFLCRLLSYCMCCGVDVLV